MAILKCKMCGGDLHFEEGASTCVCEYCGNTNTLPVVESDQEMNLFNRANHFRMINEFDRAITAYEKILDADDTNAEAHWGIVLSRYGIEYVEDPISHERIPTCHRVQMTSILSDPDYHAAIDQADVVAKAEYKAQAERIAEIQKGILAISAQEKPYDVFICYKETDESGSRTVDSTLAQEIYYGLNEAGYRVFFARITLEDKLGQQYEPYIFAALNSAKVMVVVGTKPENFNAVWVKNEWSRYLALMKEDRHRLLIPCYRDMDPYDLPDELSMLQSQDMSKIGFMQDLLRGIKKVLAKETKKTVQQGTVVSQQTTSGTTSNAQVKRGNMALEDQEWVKADQFFEEALNLDPECADAYLGKWIAQNKKPSWTALIESLKNKYADATTTVLSACGPDEEHIAKIIEQYRVIGYLEEESIRKAYLYDFSYNAYTPCRKEQKEKQQSELSSDRLLMRAQQYAKGSLKEQIEAGKASIIAVLDQRIEQAQEEDAVSIEQVKTAYYGFQAQADEKVVELYEEAIDQREKDYQNTIEEMKSASDTWNLGRVLTKLNSFGDYKDAQKLAKECHDTIVRMNEEKKRETERYNELRIKKAEQEKRRKKTLKRLGIGAAILCVVGVLTTIFLIIPIVNYNSAVSLLEKGDYDGAYEKLQKTNWKDSKEKLEGIVKDNKEKYQDAEVGDVIYFGAYEQDNKDSDGKEDIQWVVLDKDDNKLLVISKYALDCQKYCDDDEKKVPWSSSSIRNWLNTGFKNDAFSSEEKERIETVSINSKTYDGERGKTEENTSEDKVFLLSVDELNKYYSSDDERVCDYTKYANKRSGDVNYRVWNLCEWWLRDTYYYESYYYNTYAVCVKRDGSYSTDFEGYSSGSLESGETGRYVRPVIQISLTSEKNRVG